MASAVLAALLGCGRDAAARPPSGLDDALIVLPDAENVRRQTHGDARSASYELNAPFPAAGPILEIVKRLEKLGWTPLKEDSLNPGTPTSMVRGWTSFVDARKPEHVQRYSWASDWKNSGDDRASYAFAYEAPETSKAPLVRLSVRASVYPAELGARMQSEAARLSAQYNRIQGPPDDEGSVRTALEARVGSAFLVSGPEGEALLKVTGTTGEQVAYRWRFREPGGKETSGAVPVSATLRAGPFRLFWMPHSPFARTNDGFSVGFAGGVDVIPLPGDSFESLDLAQAHALATLFPDRNEQMARVTPRFEREGGGRLIALMEAGSSITLGPDRALLVQGPQGRGVIEVVEPSLKSVKYRWRFRGASSNSDTSGETEDSESPFPTLRVGPYSLQWEMRSVSEMRDEKGSRVTGWSADVKYLPEELTVETIPAGDAPKVDLRKP